MIPAADWRPWMLEWREPSGPYISRSAAAYPDQMNVVLADLWVRGCASAKLKVSPTTSMVRWSNSLVATRMLKHMSPPLVGKHVQQASVGHTQPTRACDTSTPVQSTAGTHMAHRVGAMLGIGSVTVHSESHVWDQSLHYTGLPRVSQPTALRPQPHVPLDPLFNPATCVGGLVDAWRSVQQVPGHFDIGTTMGVIIDKWLDRHHSEETDLFSVIGKNGVDPHRMESLFGSLREEIASALDTTVCGIDTGSIDTNFY